MLQKPPSKVHAPSERAHWGQQQCVWALTSFRVLMCSRETVVFHSLPRDMPTLQFPWRVGARYSSLYTLACSSATLAASSATLASSMDTCRHEPYAKQSSV